MTAAILKLDLDSLYPTEFGRKTVSEIRRPMLDWQAINAAGTGVTLTSSVWAVHADDDDGTLTLSGDGIDPDGDSLQPGPLTFVTVTGGTDGSSYRIVNTVTTSDGRTLEATLVQPVFNTRRLAA